MLRDEINLMERRRHTPDQHFDWPWHCSSATHSFVRLVLSGNWFGSIHFVGHLPVFRVYETKEKGTSVNRVTCQNR